MRSSHSNQVEYFVSHCVMTKNCNPLGHSFLLISYIDHSKGPDAKVEVLDAAGFYSRYMPILGFQPKAPGRVKSEEAKYIVGVDGISHKTFKINADQLTILLNKINEDRKNVVDRDRAVDVSKRLNRTEHFEGYRPGGPFFNAYRGNNCKNYALQLLELVDIDISSLRGFMELPRFSKDHHPLKITETTEIVEVKGKDEDSEYICDEFAPEFYGEFYEATMAESESEKKSEQSDLEHRFITAKQCAQRLYDMLDNRRKTFLEQNKEVLAIENALDAVNTINNELVKTNKVNNNYLDQIMSRLYAEFHKIKMTETEVGSELESELLIDETNDEPVEVKHFIWNVPLVLSVSNASISQEESKEISLSRQFFTAKECTQRLCDMLDNRRKTLLKQNKKVLAIDNTLDAINAINNELAENITFPNRMNNDYLTETMSRLYREVDKCNEAIQGDMAERGFGQLLKDTLNEFFCKIKAYFSDNVAPVECAPNTLDGRLASQMVNNIVRLQSI